MDQMQGIWGSFAEDIQRFLPLSPFRQYLDAFSDIPYLGYLNWFVPIRDILVVFSAWLGVITAFYLISIVLRWAKVIGD